MHAQYVYHRLGGTKPILSAAFLQASPLKWLGLLKSLLDGKSMSREQPPSPCPDPNGYGFNSDVATCLCLENKVSHWLLKDCIDWIVPVKRWWAQ